MTLGVNVRRTTVLIKRVYLALVLERGRNGGIGRGVNELLDRGD